MSAPPALLCLSLHIARRLLQERCPDQCALCSDSVRSAAVPAKGSAEVCVAGGRSVCEPPELPGTPMLEVAPSKPARGSCTHAPV